MRHAGFDGALDAEVFMTGPDRGNQHMLLGCEGAPLAKLRQPRMVLAYHGAVGLVP
ncbi:hypothetical protein D3C72_2427690 [compost metagenome]